MGMANRHEETTLSTLRGIGGENWLKKHLNN